MAYNPYAAPQAEPPRPGGPPGGAGAPQPWDVGEVLSEAWDRFKTHWVPLAFAVIVGQFLAALPQQLPSALEKSKIVTPNDSLYWPLLLACTVIGFVAQTFFQVGLTRIWLSAARGEAPVFSDLFSGGSRFLAMLGMQFLMSFVLLVGFLVLVVPGVILALGLSLAQYYLVDQEMGPVEAMLASWDATKGHKGKIFLYGLAGFLVILAGTLACCVGICAALPTLSVGTAIIYLRLSGRAPGAAQPPPWAPPAPGPYGAYQPPPPGQGPPPGYGGPTYP